MIGNYEYDLRIYSEAIQNVLHAYAESHVKITTLRVDPNYVSEQKNKHTATKHLIWTLTQESLYFSETRSKNSRHLSTFLCVLPHQAKVFL